MWLLIAEDNALMRQGLVMMFEDAGHTVVDAVGSAPELAATLAHHLDDLVLAVLDIRMPPSQTDEGARRR